MTRNLSYNSRLAPSQADFLNGAGTSLLTAAYQYNPNGRLRFVDDLRDDRFDRLYTYDVLGRVTQAQSGWNARTNINLNDNSQNGPYNHNYSFDAFSNLTSRGGSYWYHSGENYTATFSNNKNQNSGWQYDADGRVSQSVVNGSSATYTRTYNYDAAGRYATGTVMDGDGQLIRQGTAGDFIVRSTVLNQVITELDTLGRKDNTNVYVDGELVAVQHVGYPTGTYSGGQYVNWQPRHDPLNTSTTDGYAADQQAIDLQGISTEAPDYQKLSNQYSQYAQMYQTGRYGPPVTGAPGGGTPGDFGSGCVASASQRSMGPCSITTDTLEQHGLPTGMSFSFYSNLPGVYNDMTQLQSRYQAYVANNGNWGTPSWTPDNSSVLLGSNSHQNADGNYVASMSIGDGGGQFELNGDDSLFGSLFAHGETSSSHNSGKGPLTNEERFRYETVWEAANANLHSTSCSTFLAGSNFSPTNISTALAKQRPFNGLASTINALEAGVAKPGQLIAKDTVSKLFLEFGPRGMTGSWSAATRYDVYLDLSKYDPLTLVHEALHSATGLGDYPLHVDCTFLIRNILKSQAGT